MRQIPFRSLVRTLVCSGLLGGAVLLAGCSDDGPVPICENCEIWEQLSAGVARFPDPHPLRPGFHAYSTVTKTPGAVDANRESDEDIWVIYDADDAEVGPIANRTWQVTSDEMGTSGDSFAPRWSPSGTQILFNRSRLDGLFEIWRVDVTLPADPTDPAASLTLGAPVRLLARGRDPEWVSETEIVFTRESKLYRLDLMAPGTPVAEQLTFDPPIFASSDEYVDRHPDVSPDGAGVFSTLGRQPVGSILVKAFENISGVLQPTDAFVLLQPPGAVGTYPLFQGADTLRTPVNLLSLPTSEEDNQFVVGVRIDGRFLADSTRVTYCDTTLTRIVELLPGAADSVTFVFEPARGSLRVRTQRALTSVFWERADGAFSIDDFPGSTLLANAGDFRTWDCLLSWRLSSSGVPQTGNLVPYIVTGTSGGMVDQDTVFVAPDSLVVATLFDSPGPGARTGSGSVVSGKSAPPAARGGTVVTSFRADGDLGTIWRVDLSGVSVAITELTGSAGVVQHPTLSEDLGGGLRYLAFISDESGQWKLYVQRLENWVAIGEPQPVPTPGSLDNLSCSRDVFYPRFLDGSSAGELSMVCSLGDCPDNGFEDLGFDDDPWALGELRLWKVSYVPN